MQLLQPALSIVSSRSTHAWQKTIIYVLKYLGIHYPLPIHLQDAYHFLKLENGRFPVTEMCAEELLSVSMFPELTKEQIDHVVCESKRFLFHEKR